MQTMAAANAARTAADAAPGQPEAAEVFAQTLQAVIDQTQAMTIAAMAALQAADPGAAAVRQSSHR